MDTANFDHDHPKIIEIAFSFPDCTAACKKSVCSINSFWTNWPWPDWPYLFSIKSIQKISWQTFDFCEFTSTFKKSAYLDDLFWWYGWLENPAIWLAENILDHISGTKMFPNMGFIQEHSK